MSTVDRKAIVVGCGIAGPVAAMFLERIGIEPHVFDAASLTRSEPGAFLAIAPNGAGVLDTLGIRSEVLAGGVESSSTIVRDHRGKELARHDQRFTLIERDRFCERLYAAARARAIPIAFEKRLVALKNDGDRVVASFDDGSEATGAFAIGCDGLRSAVRHAMFPGALPPKYAGTVRTTGFSHLELPPSDVFQTTVGTNGSFSYQATPDGVYWHETYPQPTEHDPEELAAISDEEWLRRLERMHRTDRPHVSDILAATVSPIQRVAIHELPPLPAWSRGRVCLIGDAAHATPPYLGYGGSLALEDAVVLAKCVRDIPGIDDAFLVFERLRRARVERLVAEATQSVAAAPASFVARRIREAMMPIVWKRRVERAKRSLGFHVDWSDRAWVVRGEVG
jgi:FAD-dependent urate hydroxylase